MKPPVAQFDEMTVVHAEARCTRLRKNLGVAAKLLSRSGGQAFMLTLTYRDDVEWDGRQISECIRRLRTWAKRRFGWSLPYLWVIEAKKRQSGARLGEYRPHYHLVCWLSAGGRTE
jgi:hypothetical protein